MTTTLLKGVVGSTAYGLATPESDVDHLGVYAANTWDVLATPLFNPPQTITTTAPDSTTHEVGKYLGLVMKGNPTVTELLWLPEYITRTFEGNLLIERRSSLLGAKPILNAYGGYAYAQMKRLINRADGSFSADTRKRTGKHARHCFRLLLQGSELLQTGTLRIVLNDDEKRLLWHVSDMAEGREYGWLEKTFTSYFGILERAYEQTRIPQEPDRLTARKTLVSIRRLFLREK